MPEPQKTEVAKVSLSLLEPLLEALRISHREGKLQSTQVQGRPQATGAPAVKDKLASIRGTILPGFWSLLILSCLLYSRHIYIFSLIHLSSSSNGERRQLLWQGLFGSELNCSACALSRDCALWAEKASVWNQPQDAPLGELYHRTTEAHWRMFWKEFSMGGLAGLSRAWENA